MNRTKAHLDLKGQPISLEGLDAEELQLVKDLAEHAEAHPDWNEFSNFWMARVGGFYAARGLSRQATQQTAAYRIGSDLASRLAIRAGLARPPDYRDELENLIHTRFRTRREFCEATGISEDMLSHVLAKRKHLAINTLVEALERIGYTLHIAPMAD
ncbi:MAG TPA: hypothetical protein VFA26_26320 [Gemmataceae bacterium]|nr:hypothetical protein [Gemmataceae bacterium]